jgi:hypothetical protein
MTQLSDYMSKKQDRQTSGRPRNGTSRPFRAIHNLRAVRYMPGEGAIHGGAARKTNSKGGIHESGADLV